MYSSLLCVISDTLKCRADDRADIYADGVYVKRAKNPFVIASVTIPSNTQLLAVRAIDTRRGTHGFMIKLTNGFVTNTHWRCNNTLHDNWYNLTYNDDFWQPAITRHWPWGSHGLEPARFIWAAIYTTTVYCRGWSSKLYTR